MTTMSCRMVSPWVTALGSGDPVHFAPAERHIYTCLRCQTQLVRVRRMNRSLESLGDRNVSPPLRAPMTRTGLRETVPSGSRNLRAGVFVGAGLAITLGLVGVRRALTS